MASAMFDERNYVRKTMNVDPLNDAEQITGVSIDDPDDRSGMADGLLRVHAYAADRRAALESYDDTFRSCRIERYLRVANDVGFKPVYTETYTPKYRDGHTERLRVLATEDGLVLVMTSFANDTQADGATLYVNWAPHERKDSSLVRLSGGVHCTSGWDCDELDVQITRSTTLGYTDADRAIRANVAELAIAAETSVRHRAELTALWDELLAPTDRFTPATIDELIVLARAAEAEKNLDHSHIWVGSVHVTEGLRLTVDTLRDHGKLFAPWVARRSFWVTSPADPKDALFGGRERVSLDTMDVLTARRVAQFDPWVQNMIAAPEAN